MYRRTPYMDLPPTTVVPMKPGDKTKNKVKNANVSPLNLGNAFVDDNVGGDDVMFLGEHNTVHLKKPKERIILGLAGILQKALLRKNADVMLGGHDNIMTTQEYVKKVNEDVFEADHFTLGPWLRAIVHLHGEGGRPNRGQGMNPWGGNATGYGEAQNRVGNVNQGQARPGQARTVKCYNCNGTCHIARNCTQPKRPQYFEYFKDKMLLMQAQENRVALNAEQLLFLTDGLDNAFDDDVDEQPVQDMALNVDNVFQAEDSDRITDEAGPSYDSDILPEVQDHDQYLDDTCAYHEEHVMHDSVQLDHVVDLHADYMGVSNMISYDQYVKDNDVSVVHSNASSVPNDTFMMIYDDMCKPFAPSVSNSSRNAVVKNYLTAELATYREQVELPRPLYNDLNKTKACYLQEVIPFFQTIKDNFERIQKALTKEVKQMKDVFEELEAEVAQSRFAEMHVANTSVEARCLAFEAELATLRDKSYQKNQGELNKHFYKLEVDHLNLQIKYQNLKDSIGNHPPTPDKDTPDFDSVFVISKMQASLQGKDNAIRQLKKQLSELQVTSSDTERIVRVRTTDSQLTKVTDPVTNLQAQNDLFRAEIDKVKQHYKQLYDSIKITSAKHIEQVTKLTAKNVTLITSVSKAKVQPSILTRTKHAVDVELLVPCLRNNRDAHLDYLRYLQESVETIRNIVEKAKVVRPLYRSIISACRYTQHSQELLEYAIGVKRCPKASGSQPKSNYKTNRISPAKCANKLPVEDLPRMNKSHLRTTNRVDSSSRLKHTVVQIILWYLDSGCSKHITRDRARLLNFVKKFIWTVRFGNDNFGAIMGFGDYVVGESVISRGSRGSNLYTISVEDMMKSSPICLLSKASKNKSWLWHQRLNHLNSSTINDLVRKDLVRGLPRLKFKKDHLCSACQLGKSKKHTHKPKAENTNLEDLNTLHMDLCGPMRVQTINGKKYILVIMDDYSRFTWVKFLKSKDETSDVVIKFITQIQVGLNKTVRYVRTDNGTEFVNHTMTEYYERIGVFHQKTVPKTPQQNEVVERRNRTLVEAARTMLIFFKALMFLWAEDVATACYTQNRSLIHTRHHKTPYELVHNKKPDLTFFKVFGTLCYPINDSKDLGKLQPTADTEIFVGYAPSRKGLKDQVLLLKQYKLSQLSRLPPGVVAEPHFMEDHNVAPVDNNPFVNVFAPEPHSEASSSGDISSTESPYVSQSLHHLNKWSKDHLLDNVIGNPSKLIAGFKPCHRSQDCGMAQLYASRLDIAVCGRSLTGSRKLPEEAQPYKARHVSIRSKATRSVYCLFVPRGFIYQNKDKKNRLMWIDELHKFSDRTLNDVHNALDDHLKGIRMQYLPTTIWRKGDKDRAAAMIQAIDKMLKTRRIMRSLERGSPKSVGESEAEEVPAEKPQVADEDADFQKAVEESMKDAYALPKGSLPPVVIREPESGKYQPLPEVPGKGKAKVSEEQVAHDLLSLQKYKKTSPADQYIFQRRVSKPTASSFHDGSQDEGQAGPDPNAQAEGQARLNPEKTSEGQAGSNPDETSKGQAGPDPNAQAEGQTGSDTGAQAEGQARLNPEKTSEGQAGSNPDETSKGQAGPDPGFTATIYPNVQENLKLVVEEPVLLEEPTSSSRTLSSLQHLSRDFTFGDQFFSDKPSDADKSAETKVESMVNVPIQQALSSICLMTSPIIDLTSRLESPKEHQQLKATTTDTTTTITTTLPPPQAPQQSTTEAMMVKRIGELEHTLADLIQVNKTIEERLDKHGARLYTLKQLDIPQQVSIAVSKVVMDAVDWAMQVPLRDRFRDLPEADIKEILHQRMWETDSYKSHEDHMQLFEALEKSINRDQFEELTHDLAEARKKRKKGRESPKTPPGSPSHQPPPPPPPAGLSGTSGAPRAFGSQVTPPPPPPTSTNQDSPSTGSVAPSPAKTAATTKHQAWSTPDVTLTPLVSLTPEDLDMDEAMGPDEQAQLSDEKDIRSAHIPTVNLRQGWWKPFEEERPTTSEPAWSIRSSDVPTGDITTFMDWFCKRRGITELKPQDLEGPAYEIVKDITAMYGISHWWFQRQRFYIDRHTSEGDRSTVRTHMRILSVIRIKVFSMYGYDYIKKIVLRPTDLNEHVIAERDFKQLVIRQRVENFQLRIENYQTQVNLTKPQWMATGFEYKHDYTVIESSRVVIFRDKYGVQMMMRFNEIHKFSDGTLHQIVEALDYRVKEFRINRMNPGLNTRFWTRNDVDRCNAFMFVIQRHLKTHRIFRNLESFIRGRVREGDYRLLKRID
uniref:Retrovirus-related Pol polyprotein from transposon TNT 1-94 n=1 Tax=Tanacetum cinerariifolium TaxID=118510 RepID=A0A6L2K2W2_TANCI|nr:hypothetical protein [Tanacetum cinerariifolium]